MTVTPELERKVRQLDNDVAAIYTMISELAGTQRRHGNRLDEIAATQGAHSATLAEHSATLAEHSTKLDAILEILRAR